MILNGFIQVILNGFVQVASDGVRWFQSVTSRRKIPENAEKMRVGLEHPPTLPTRTTSIGAFLTPTQLSTYPPTPNSHHIATYNPHHPPNPRHHTTTQPHLPQTPTLTPTPAHTTYSNPRHTVHATHLTYTHHPKTIVHTTLSAYKHT